VAVGYWAKCGTTVREILTTPAAAMAFKIPSTPQKVDMALNKKLNKFLALIDRLSSFDRSSGVCAEGV
jgi:hypothetical protein